jgi:hypothetical protein
MTNIQSFPEIPIELVREILEVAAFSSNKVACALLRVSKDVHTWVLPYLFHTILIRRTSQLDDLMQCCFQRDGGDIYSRHIHRLAVSWEVEEDISAVYSSLSYLLEESKSLRSLLLPDLYHMRSAVAHSTSITELYIMNWAPPFQDISNVTHLQLGEEQFPMWQQTVHEPLILRAEAPRLSHFSLFGINRDISFPSQPVSIPRTIAALLLRPSIHIIAFTFIREVGVREGIPILTDGRVSVPLRHEMETITDPRFYLLSDDSWYSSQVCMKRWEQGSRGGEGFWEEMERMVSQRSLPYTYCAT